MNNARKRECPTHLLLFSICVAIALFSGSDIFAANAADPEKSVQVGSNLEFFDSDSFDKKLSSVLKTDPPTVTVKFAGAVSINKIPERLDKWFSAVEANQGKVRLEAQGTSPKLIGDLVSLIVGAYDHIKDKILYGPAEDYDVSVFYDKVGGTINKLTFTHKPSKPSEQ